MSTDPRLYVVTDGLKDYAVVATRRREAAFALLRHSDCYFATPNYLRDHGMRRTRDAAPHAEIIFDNPGVVFRRPVLSSKTPWERLP